MRNIRESATRLKFPEKGLAAKLEWKKKSRKLSWEKMFLILCLSYVLGLYGVKKYWCSYFFAGKVVCRIAYAAGAAVRAEIFLDSQVL